jgi:deoxycytidine triphosphate deaminase/addiction module HigA family antidote
MLHKDRAAATPGAHLRAEIERLGLDQVAVAEAAGVSRQTINNIVNDRQTISRAMAAKLGRLTGRASDYWLRSLFPDPEADTQQRELGEPERAALRDRADFRPAAVLVNHQIIRAIEEGFIEIDPFEPKNVQLASLDLTLDDFIITTEGEEIDISEGHSFILEGGQTVNVRTREWIEFPLDYVGRVGAMTQLAKFGIIMSHGFQVDPGYKGQLQFCLFNAGRKRFELRSGERIISLEITPLSSLPSTDEPGRVASNAFEDRADVASHFRGTTGRTAADRLIRDFLRDYVEIDDSDDRITARLLQLDIEIIESSKEAAFAGTVSSALHTLMVLRANPNMTTALHNKYEAFFNDVAKRLCLSGQQARDAVALLGLPFQDKDNSIVKLRSGDLVTLQLPKTSAKITLKNLSRQLHMNAHDLVLFLTDLMPKAAAPTAGPASFMK